MSSTDPPQFNPSSLILVSRPTFLGLVWTCVGFSLCFVLFRIYVRLRVFRRLSDDDFLVVLAWLILFTCTILWHVERTLELLYESYYIGYGGRLPSKYYLEHFEDWLHINFAELLLNLIGLWCIKFAFLAFFRRLGRKVKGQKIIWYVVFALTVAGLAISVGVCYFPCIFATYHFEETFCPRSEAGAAIRRSYRIQIGLDFSTDFLIMMIPVQLLWNVKINLKQKVGLLIIFSLTLITMVFSIVRVEISLRGPREDDVFFFLCATFELTVAILVACIFSYRSLFSPELKARKSNKRSAAPLVNNGGRNDTRGIIYTEATGGSGAVRQGRESFSTLHGGDGIEIVPLDMICVRNEFAVDSHGAVMESKGHENHMTNLEPYGTSG